MAPLGALSQARVAIEASTPLGCHLLGVVWEFGGEWVAISEGPDGAFQEGSGDLPDVALRQLSDRLRELRGVASG